MAHGKKQDPVAPFMSEEEVAFLSDTYQKSRVILEYGSGGSTRIAAQIPGKLVFSVESDVKWALDLDAEIQASAPASRVIIYPVDIGAVGPWGRPLSEKDWRKFYRYPLAIWDEPFFRHPDVVLIDGRMRVACMATLLLYIDRPVTVLFDDYRVRKLYQVIERLVQPKHVIGTLAHFELEPGMVRKEDLGFLIAQFSRGSIHGAGEDFYNTSEFVF